MSLSEVVTLRPEPPLNDIAARLRWMADGIESGEFGKIEAAYVVLGVQGEFTPLWYGFGAVADRHGICGVFSHIAHLALHSNRT